MRFSPPRRHVCVGFLWGLAEKKEGFLFFSAEMGYAEAFFNCLGGGNWLVPSISPPVDLFGTPDGLILAEKSPLLGFFLRQGPRRLGILDEKRRRK